MTHENDLGTVMQEAEGIVTAWEPTKIHFGEGAVDKTGKLIKKYGGKVLIITGQGSVKTAGYLDRIIKSLDYASVAYHVCGGVEPNPSKETVYRIAYHLLAGGYDCILALGGWLCNGCGKGCRNSGHGKER